MSTNTPVRLLAYILISALNTLLSSLPSSTFHSASINLTLSSSDRLITLIQSVRCMDTPLPLVTKPTISSPGTGLQHLEKRTATSSIPSTTIPLLDFLEPALVLRYSDILPRTSSSVISVLFFLL